MSRLPPPLSVSSWSLRARLLAAVVGLVAIALATVGTTGITMLRSYLVQQIDDQLSMGAARVAAGPAGASAPPAGTQLPTPFVFAQLSPSGTLLQQRGGFGTSTAGAPGAQPVLAGITPAKVASADGKPFTVPATSGGSGFRVLAVEDADGAVGVVAMPLSPVDGAVHRLEMITWLVAAIILAVLVIVGTIAVRLGLRPLANVERTAEAIAAGDLSRRVAGGPPGTEVGRLANALNAMLAQIEASMAARDRSEQVLRRFIADASHELRTPLTTVRGYAELARKGAFPDGAAAEHGMERIEAEATRMGVMVDDLLLLAHLDQNRPLRTEDVNLSVLTADAVADARVRSPGRHIHCMAPADATLVAADPDRLRQVLGNLIGNAVTHTPDGTPVRVELRRAGAVVEVEVADAGPGLEPHQVERLFERFYRVDQARSRARGGSGLGLAIVQAIVHASRGTVRCTSERGSGTSFVVSLPAHSARSASVEVARS